MLITLLSAESERNSHMVVKTWEELFAAVESTAKGTFLEVNDSELPGHTLELDSHITDIHLRFYRVKFTGSLSWNQVFFHKGLSFVDVDFEGEALFSGCHFHGPAYFWKCRFHKKADFSHTIALAVPLEHSRLHAGEANFSYSRFSAKADFRHAVLNGKTWFWRTVFDEDVDFEEARFEAGVQFASRLEDICVSDSELVRHVFGEDLASRVPREKATSGVSEEDRKLLSILQPMLETLKASDAQVLVKCEDRTSGYFNFLTEIDSLQVLQRRLKKLHLLEKASLWARVKSRVRASLQAFRGKGIQLTLTQLKRLVRRSRLKEKAPKIQSQEQDQRRKDSQVREEAYARVCELWSEYHSLYMFSMQPKYCLNFMKVSFGPDSWFRQTSMKRCLFRGADLTKVRFENVQWHGPGMLSLNRRYKIYDEVWLKAEIMRRRRRFKFAGPFRKEAAAVSSAYHDLKQIAECAGDRRLSRHFHFGELESARYARPWPSILAYAYRIASGYGTREYRALLVLLFLMLTFFPVAFITLGQIRAIPEGAKFSPYFSSIFSQLRIGQNWKSAETTSLEASTFLLRPVGAQTDPTGRAPAQHRLTEAIERLVVTTQGALLVLALKSRFQRGPE